jgi:hypothetical protein
MCKTIIIGAAGISILIMIIMIVMIIMIMIIVDCAKISGCAGQADRVKDHTRRESSPDKRAEPCLMTSLLLYWC